MVVNMTKTYSQHVHRRDDIKATTEEAAKAAGKYSHQCDFCKRRFKTRRNMLIHRANCDYNYATTDETFELEEIIDVYGHIDNRWFLAKWKGYPEPEWEREHLFLRDGCQDAIRSFWVKSNLLSCKKFYHDKHGKPRCSTCNKTFKRRQDLKAHRTRTGHSDRKQEKITRTAYVDAVEEKRKAQQKLLPKVEWQHEDGKVEVAHNKWHFKYLGAIMEAGGSQDKDVNTRIAMARTRFGKLHHLWKDKHLHLNLRLRLYKSSVCSIMTYGSEAWALNEATIKKLNGANAQMVSIISGKTPHQEASSKWRTFDLVRWIRARRLAWLGHILRMGTERKLKQAVYEIFKYRQPGDLLMDAPPHTSWRNLCEKAFENDKESWKARVRVLNQSRIQIDIGSHIAPAETLSFTIS